MSKNSLSTLIGQYSTDSENEDEASNVSDKNGNGSQLPATQWTQCTDPNTGHPYYWNVETKEVTWEPPEEYENYLKNISKMFTKIPDNCWIRGYSQAVQQSYYVNEYTRVVSWKMPANYKEPTVDENKKTEEIDKNTKNKTKPTRSEAMTKLLKKKKNKKSLPQQRLETKIDEDNKIELITSYSKAETDSEEDREKNEKDAASLTTSNRNLVAAYATDESDSETEGNSKQHSPIIKKSEPENELKSTEEKPTKENSNTSFSNIIVGGGVPDANIDEEIMRLKKELENDLISLDNANEKKEKSPEINDNFDEKTFQRKKRIQFKTTTEQQQVENVQNTGVVSQSTSLTVDKEKYNLYKNFQRSHVEFENTRKENETISTSIPLKDESLAAAEADESKIFKKEIDDLIELISGKVKFLAVGHAEVSAVQAMNIQLETLLVAFNTSALDSEYFFKWLKGTSDDLNNLEQNACPDGWKCMWDRESSQYCYKNLVTGDMQWEFPKDDKSKNDQKEQSKPEEQGHQKDEEQQQQEQQQQQQQKEDEIRREGIAGGEDMDISTTPPPNENEQLKIENVVAPWDEFNPPPPPQITVQPPLPPNISCELASFYSDIATLEYPTTLSSSSSIPLPATSGTLVSATTENSPQATTIELLGKRRSTETTVDNNTIKKKRKKVKVQGLGLKMQEVSTMVANWKKAQKELDN